MVVDKEEDESPKGADNEEFIWMVSHAMNIGFSIILPIVGGVLLGRYIDNYFHSAPRYTLISLFLGIFLGISNSVFLIKRITKK